MKINLSKDKFINNRLIKTSIPKIVKTKFCYIDNDVLAINNVDEIFSEFKKPITFATDHVVTVNHFSPWAVKKGTLQENIFEKFKVKVDANWSLWNGGVFVGDENSKEFFDIWNDYTKQILEDENWIKRDQGSLTATVWKLGLQNHSRLPIEYNWISQHTSLTNGPIDFEKIKLIHFIHKGKGTDKEEFNQVKAMLVGK